MALVLWSGGVDSTFLLYDLLTASNNRRGEGEYVKLTESETVRTISINHPQITMSEMGAMARKKLVDKLKKKHGFKGFAQTEIIISQTGPEANRNHDDGVIQPVIWLAHAVQYLDTSEDCYIAYIRGDDVWHYRNYLYQAFDSLQALLGKTGKLMMPLEWVKKSEIINRLESLKLLKHTWYCELPTKDEKPCGQCASCQTHKLALLFNSEGMGKPFTCDAPITKAHKKGDDEKAVS